MPVAAQVAVLCDQKLLPKILAERVAKGAALLDEHFGGPGWIGKVDWAALDFVGVVDGKNNDILAQLFRDPYATGALLGVDNQESYYGFRPPLLDQGEALVEAWKAYIRMRLTSGEIDIAQYLA